MIVIRDEMTREELLEFMKETRGRGVWRFTTESGKELSGTDTEDAVIEQLEQIYEQESKRGWIPVSERLPEHEGWYLVSLKNGNVQKAWYRVAPINQGGSYWRGSIKRPIAWMPLPEPYKAGRASDDR